MTARYLLDTNIISSWIRTPRGPVQQRLAAVGENDVCTSIIVLAELRYGAARIGSEPLRRRIEDIVGRMDVLPLTPPADTAYADIRTELERAGTPIGANDLLIAAQARALGLIVVTDNEREFGRVAGLQVENWLR